MARKLADVLQQSGSPTPFQAGGKAPEKIVDREIKKEPCPRA